MDLRYISNREDVFITNFSIFKELIVKKGLIDIINSTLLKGTMTWARGGGWNGPYVKCNEFWQITNCTYFFVMHMPSADVSIT